MKNNTDFSLADILVVIGILVILSFIAIPSYKNYRLNTYSSVVDVASKDVHSALQACLLDSDSITECNSFAELRMNCTTMSSSDFGSSLPADAPSDIGLVCKGMVTGTKICIQLQHSENSVSKACVDSEGTLLKTGSATGCSSGKCT